MDLLDGNDIDVKSVIEEKCEGFTYGDMTSVSISGDGKLLAVAIQAEGYTDNGRVAVFTCEADGTLKFEAAYETGVQPDMVTFTPGWLQDPDGQRRRAERRIRRGYRRSGGYGDGYRADRRRQGI